MIDYRNYSTTRIAILGNYDIVTTPNTILYHSDSSVPKKTNVCLPKSLTQEIGNPVSTI